MGTVEGSSIFLTRSFAAVFRFLVVIGLSPWCCALLPSHALAQRDVIDVQVGDIIEFEYHGTLQQKEVLELVGHSKWFRVMADFGDRQVPYTVLPHKAKIVRRGGDAKGFPVEPRVWTDATGKFTVEAELHDLNENEVALLKSDGKVVTLPVEKLSEADQAYLQQLSTPETLESKENPFAGGVPATPTPRASENLAAPNPMLSQRRPTLPLPGKNPIAANEIPLDYVGWTYVPGEHPKHQGDASLRLPPAMFPQDKDFFTKAAMYFSGNSGELLAVLRTNSFSNYSQASVFDVNAKTLFGDFKIPYKDLKDVVVSPNRKILVTIHPQLGAERGGLVFWNIEDDQLTAKDVWDFSSLGSSTRFSAHSSLFVDDKHLFTIGTHLALWDIENETSIYSISDPGAWTISRNHEHVLFFKKNALWLLRIKDGQLVGRITGEPKLVSKLKSLDFSPDGGQLVAASGSFVYGFDLTTGQPSFEFDTGQTISSVQWADNALLLVNNRSVFEPTLEVPVWQFTMDHRIQLGRVGSTAWIASVDQLVGVELINQKRRVEIERNTVGLEAENLLTFGPGTRLALVTQLENLGQPYGPVVTAMKKHLEGRGFVLDDRAPLKLEAVVKRGQTVEQLVRDQFGSIHGRAVERIRYTPHSSYLTLTLNGEVLWKTSAHHSAAGPILLVDGNETAQQAVDRMCRPNSRFFTNAQVPSKISRLPKDRSIGKTRITAAGLQ